MQPCVSQYHAICGEMLYKIWMKIPLFQVWSQGLLNDCKFLLNSLIMPIFKYIPPHFLLKLSPKHYFSPHDDMKFYLRDVWMSDKNGMSTSRQSNTWIGGQNIQRLFKVKRAFFILQFHYQNWFRSFQKCGWYHGESWNQLWFKNESFSR